MVSGDHMGPTKRPRLRMGVLTKPGHTADTPTPQVRQSARRDRENMSTAALVVQ